MDTFTRLTGRHYHLFDYAGAPDTERVIVVIGSGAETVQATVDHLIERGEKVGVVKVRLFRPFSVEHFLHMLPPTVKVIATLDGTKEPGGVGEPLNLDVTATDFALTSGVHTAQDVLKAMMAGANVTMMTSTLLTNGIGRLMHILNDLQEWMEEHEYASIGQMRGSMSQQAVADPAAFERANYMRALSSSIGRYGPAIQSLAQRPWQNMLRVSKHSRCI